MRILKVTQVYHPFRSRGGPAVKVRAIAERLAGRGHLVTVLTASLGPEQAPGIVRAGGVEAVYLRPVLRWRATTVNAGLADFCRKRLAEFDLAHIYGLYDFLGPAVARHCRSGIPYVIEPMGMFRPIVRSIPIKRLYHLLVGGRMFAGAQKVVATSEFEQGELAAGGIPADRIAVRRNGVDVPDSLPEAGNFRRRWSIPPEAPVVLFLGRLEAKKSPDLLMEAFAEWRRGRSGQTSLLVLAGPAQQDYLARLEQQAARLRLEESILFTGPLYDEAKWEAYRDADIFVLPSQSENFGNTVAEAVVAGTPVLVTDRCGIAPLVADRAGLVVPYGKQPLVNGLARLLADDTLRSRYRTGCKLLLRELSWEEPVKQMEAIYSELLGAPAERAGAATVTV
jgi:glycosyltransferase involved in cell wall biosynthesis